MRIIKYTKETTLPKADYIFEKISDFKKIAPYIKEKIEGEWLIILLKFNYKQIEEVISMDIPECANLHFYVTEDIKDKLSLKYPDAVEKDRSKFDIYLDYIDSINLSTDDKVIRELYTRNRGNLEEIKICVNRLKELEKEHGFIDMSILDKVIEKDEVVYAKDVIYTYLLSNNTDVPKRGSILSRYRYRNKHTMRDKLLDNISEEVAFYAIRKVLKSLYDEKINYLNAKECKELEVCKVLDYYTIAHAWLTFKMSKPSQFEICLLEIERRERNDSIFTRTILGSYT